jgi:ribose 5-phosphate isomerase A
MTPQEAAAAKEAAANFAVENFVKPGMRLGLGSGTTAAFAVRALARRFKTEALELCGIVSTSTETAALARSLGISLQDDLTPDITPIDVTIDGADDVDSSFNLIKGGGGALLREKIVAKATLREVIIVDETKFTDVLGVIFPLPVMIAPYGWEITKSTVEKVAGRASNLRKTAAGDPFVSNDGLYCLDLEKGPIPHPALLEQRILSITGVVDVGLFVNIAKNVVIGHADGRVTQPEQKRSL